MERREIRGASRAADGLSRIALRSIRATRAAPLARDDGGVCLDSAPSNPEKALQSVKIPVRL